jgi:hypothetical protein
MYQILNTLRKLKSFKGKAVILFGHCNATEKIIDYLFQKGIAATAILDNSISKQGFAYRKIPIVPPEQIKCYNSKNSIVLIATRFFEPMFAQLRELGYDGKIIKVADYNSFAEYSLSDETLSRKKARVERGAKTLKKIRTQYASQHLIICPNNALGDVYWAMSFLPAYRKKHGICDVAVIVIGKGCREAAELFGIENIVSLSQTEMDEFVQAIIFTREENCIIAHHDRPYTDNIIKYLDKYFLSFIDYYKRVVYGLSKTACATPPVSRESFENIAKIPKAKSVIISPYAKSVVGMPNAFWEKICKEYKEKGFHVYTNIVGDELPIDGTLPLSLSIKQIIPVVEHAGTFIGIRSGLCDILHTAKCHKTVVFPDCYYSTTPHKVKDFFAIF